MSGFVSDALAAFVRTPTRVRRLDGGHINETYVAGEGAAAIVVQRLNPQVFPDPASVAGRLFLVAEVAREEPGQAGGPATPEPLLTRDGRRTHTDPDGGVWRAYRYVAGRVPGRAHAAAIARAFGALARMLEGLDPAATPVVIAGFHDLDARVAQFERAVAGSAGDRGALAADEIAAAQDLVEQVRALDEHDSWVRLPQQVVHNDAKRANVLRARGGSLCIIDTDTVGAGSILYDVGGLVRSAVREAFETPRSGRSLAPAVRATIGGFLAGWESPLDPAERDSLPIAGLMLTLENGLRFLTDFLTGDRYFAVVRPGQNLDRARVQLGLARCQLAQLDHMRTVCERVLRSG